MKKNPVLSCSNPVLSRVLDSRYIREYDFAKGKFDSLPPEIFQANPETLSKMDRVILNGIKFQMMVSKYNEWYQKVNYNIRNIKHTGTNWSIAGEHRIVPAFSGLNPVLSCVLIPILGFFLLSLTYYANVNLHLGMNFLTELFA
jgi:hypothetical protein